MKKLIPVGLVALALYGVWRYTKTATPQFPQSPIFEPPVQPTPAIITGRINGELEPIVTGKINSEPELVTVTRNGQVSAPPRTVEVSESVPPWIVEQEPTPETPRREVIVELPTLSPAKVVEREILNLKTLAGQGAATWNLPTGLVYGIIATESSWNPDALNKEGTIDTTRWSVGLMQIQARTAKDRGFTGTYEGLFDPVVNVRYGCKQLAWLRYHLANQPWEMTISAYNQGLHGSQTRGIINKAYVDRVKLAWAQVDGRLTV